MHRPTPHSLQMNFWSEKHRLFYVHSLHMNRAMYIPNALPSPYLHLHRIMKNKGKNYVNMVYSSKKGQSNPDILDVHGYLLAS